MENERRGKKRGNRKEEPRFTSRGNGRGEESRGEERTGDQVVEDVSLVNVNGDERLEADGVDLGEVQRRLRDEHVEDVEELLVGRLHQLLVVHAVGQRLLRIARPHELQRQQAHLQRTPHWTTRSRVQKFTSAFKHCGRLTQ